MRRRSLKNDCMALIGCQKQLTIISTAFPNVALIKPPRIEPTFAASCSVEKVSIEARGNMAKKLRTKTAAGLQWYSAATTPSGTNGSRRFAGLYNNVALIVIQV